MLSEIEINNITLEKNLKNIAMHLLERIKNILIFNASFINRIGLMQGKLGIAIFLFYLSKFDNSKENYSYANLLLDEIASIQNQITVDFNNGLSGIGYGISFLNRNKFINIDTNSILENLDSRIYKYVTGCSFNDIETMLSVSKYIMERLNDIKKSSNEYYLFIELLIILTEKLEYFYFISLKHINALSDKWFTIIIRMFEFLFNLRRYNINKTQSEDLILLLKKLVEKNICISSEYDGIYSFAIILFTTQFINLTTIDVQKIMKIQGDLTELNSVNISKQIKLLMLYETLNSFNKKILDRLLYKYKEPSIIKLSQYGIDTLLVNRKNIPLGLYGLSGLGLLLLNFLSEKRIVSKELCSQIAIS